MNNAEMKLELFKEEDFLGTKCNFYKDENNSIYMTRKQIGEALQYKDSDDAMYRLHDRNRERLDKFSVKAKINAADGKQYITTLYTKEGIVDICVLSSQPWYYKKHILCKIGLAEDKVNLVIGNNNCILYKEHDLHKILSILF